MAHPRTEKEGEIERLLGLGWPVEALRKKLRVGRTAIQRVQVAVRLRRLREVDAVSPEGGLDG